MGGGRQEKGGTKAKTKGLAAFFSMTLAGLPPTAILVSEFWEKGL